jgi:ATP/maltotriose-dependent transcriptional regulator MalT
VSTSLVSPVFVGRQTERSTLVDLLQVAMDGSTQFVLVGGEAGVGKSRLVAELVAEADLRQVRVLSGQCVQLGNDGVPFAPLVDALRVLARSMPREEFDRALGPARRALLRLLPNIDPDPDDVPVGPIVQGSQLLELVLGMLERLAGSGPVLIVIEDLHWADQSTLDLVAYLVRAMRAVPVLLVGTFRSDELSRRHPLRSLLLPWERGRVAHFLDLARFDRQEVSDQLGAILGRAAEPGLVDSVYERSEGNAFLVEEMLGVVLAGGEATVLPQSLRDVLLSRVDGVGPEARRLLSTAAVGGRWVSEQLLLAVSGLEESAAFAGLREAVEQHLLVVDDAGRGYSFRHALARDAVYDDLLPGERSRLHAAYGDVLSAQPELAGDDRGTLAADLAHHWYVALDLPRALPASIEAAARALDRFAPAEALRQLERALQIWPRVPEAEAVTGIDHVEVLRRCAQVASEIGEVHRTLSLVREALDELGEDGDSDRRAQLLERLGSALHQAGHTTQGIAVLRQAVEILPTEGNTEAYAAVFAELANAMFRTGRWEEANQLSRRAADAAEAAGADRQRAEALVTLAVVRVLQGEFDAGMAMGRDAIDLALRLGHASAGMRGYINLSDTLERLGRSADAAALAAEGRLLAERSGYARSTGAFLAGNEGESLTRLGRYAEAEQLVSSMIATEPEGVFAATLLDVRAQIEVRQGRYDLARRDVARARAVLGDQSELQFTRAFAATETLLRLADGDEEAALAGLKAELASPEVEFRYDAMLVWLAHRTHANQAQRARDRGVDPPAIDPVFVRALDRVTPEGDTQRAFEAMTAAEVARAAGSVDPEVWQAVAELWRGVQRPYELAESLLRLAEVCAVTGHRGRAQDAAAEAYRIVTEIGAAALAEQVAQLGRQARLDLAPDAAADLAADPAPVGSARPDELERFGLTQREREVLAMVAAGRTNPEIAKSLFISPKTASVHVSNILAKLGVASRVEAATMAHRLGIATS